MFGHTNFWDYLQHQKVYFLCYIEYTMVQNRSRQTATLAAILKTKSFSIVHYSVYMQMETQTLKRELSSNTGAFLDEPASERKQFSNLLSPCLLNTSRRYIQNWLPRWVQRNPINMCRLPIPRINHVSSTYFFHDILQYFQV